MRAPSIAIAAACAISTSGALAAEVRVPTIASEWIELRDAGVAFRTRVSTALPSNATWIAQSRPDGVEDYVVYERAPAGERIAYDLDLGEGVVGLRLVRGFLELLDRGGAPRWRMRPPRIVDADGRWLDAEVALPDCRVSRDPRPPWDVAPTDPGKRRCTLEIRWSGVRYPAVLDPTWETTGSLLYARPLNPAMTLLPSSGRVLLVGGIENELHTEIFDPATETWTSGPTLMNARFGTKLDTILNWRSPPQLLLDDRVYVLGGGFAPTTVEHAAEGDATFSLGLPLGSARQQHDAVRVGAADQVLVVGGCDPMADPMACTAYELYSPSAGSTPVAGTGDEPAAAAELVGGNALIVWPYLTPPMVQQGRTDIYDGGAVSEWVTLAPDAGALGFTLTALSDGSVVRLGGSNILSILNLAAAFEPAPEPAWRAIAYMPGPHAYHTATLLDADTVLIVGGEADPATLSAEVHVFFRASNQWLTLDRLAHARRYHATVQLTDGRVLVAGGEVNAGDDARAVEILDFAAPHCGGDEDCNGGACVDEVCCDRPCGGPCEACNLPNLKGTCSFIVGTPRAACQTGAPGTEACDATCNGKISTCVFGGDDPACVPPCHNVDDCPRGDVCSFDGFCEPAPDQIRVESCLCSAPGTERRGDTLLLLALATLARWLRSRRACGSSCA